MAVVQIKPQNDTPYEASAAVSANVFGHSSRLAAHPILLSVVVPIKNEVGNIRPLIDECLAVITPVLQGQFEIIYVDDGSTDDSLSELQAAMEEIQNLRVYRHETSCGQSAAIRTGILGARGLWIVTLDGDGQNDPADIPAMLEVAGITPYEAHDLQPFALVQHPNQMPTQPTLVAGQRVNRKDTFSKRISSKIANSVRDSLLGDGVKDTGCGLKLFRRDAFLRLPYFDHAHRYLPALMRREGFQIATHPVSHRSRERGTSKYGMMNRLWVGIVDLLGVMWLNSRRRKSSVSEIVLPNQL